MATNVTTTQAQAAVTAVSQASSSSAPPSQEFVVRVPKDVKKKYGVMKFNPNNKVDFTKCDGAKIERENNLKDYKAAHNLETMPQFGAGSEYGRDLREEARLKKLGINRKSYIVENQPWKLKLGTGKATRHFKGTKEGGILENASYYIFTQCPDGAFEAFPVDEWHNFSPAIKYKHLTAEEAEERFSKREQIMNYHSIMVQKRFREDVVEEKEEDGEEKRKGKTKKSSKDFLLTDLDEWAIMSDDSQGEGLDSEEEKPREKKSKKTKVSKRSGDKRNSDDEAVEESDEENEGREVDYMTDTDSEDDDMYADKDREAADKYREKGVEDEEALHKLIESDAEEADEKDKEEQEEEEEGKSKAGKGSGSDSSSSSDSDSDPEKDGSFSSALFMPKKDAQEKKKKNKGEKEDKKQKGMKSLKRKGSFSSEGSAASNSRCATPTATADTVTKLDTSPLTKKSRTESSTPTPGAGNEGLSEETVRRYLMRKPMTIKDLLHKFKNCGLPKEKLMQTVADILKKVDPEKTVIKDKLYLSIKAK